MKTRNEFRLESSNPWMAVLGLVAFVVVMIGLFWLARMAFSLLYYLSPILLIATLFLDRKVLIGYGRWLIGLVKRNAVLGILAILLTIVGFPVVTAFLFIRALFNRQARKAMDQQAKGEGGEYVDFQELPSEKPLELRETEVEEKRDTSGEDYKKLFD